MRSNMQGWGGLLAIIVMVGLYRFVGCDRPKQRTMSEILSKYPTASETISRERADRAEFEGRFEEAARIRREGEEAARKEREFQAWRKNRDQHGK